MKNLFNKKRNRRIKGGTQKALSLSALFLFSFLFFISFISASPAYDAYIATIVVADDAEQVTKSMVKQTTWREGTSGDWSSSDCTLIAGNTYQFRSPVSGHSASDTTVLPNIKANVTIEWDTSGNIITDAGSNFMRAYAYECSNLISITLPDMSGLTSVGDSFMRNYVSYCTSLTYLSIPDLSKVTEVGNHFMYYYAYGCSSLTSLGAPDLSNVEIIRGRFMYYYAYGCSNLISLSIPDLSKVTEVGNYFMYGYAQGCSSLTSLDVPDLSNVEIIGDGFMGYYAYGCSELISLSGLSMPGLTSVGVSFMSNYARSCSKLTSLGAPNLPNVENIGNSFMYYYASGCTSLTSLSIPDLSNVEIIGDGFMEYYAYNCISLLRLELPENTGYFENNVNWKVPANRLNILKGYVQSEEAKNAWGALTTEGKTLYTNYIRSAEDIIVSFNLDITNRIPLNNIISYLNTVNFSANLISNMNLSSVTIKIKCPNSTVIQDTISYIGEKQASPLWSYYLESDTYEWWLEVENIINQSIITDKYTLFVEGLKFYKDYSIYGYIPLNNYCPYINYDILREPYISKLVIELK